MAQKISHGATKSESNYYQGAWQLKFMLGVLSCPTLEMSMYSGSGTCLDLDNMSKFIFHL
jgi:hypothetical protein